MSKHREALRRGIRSLIQETSRELADLEGREAPDGAAVSSGESPAHPAPADGPSGAPEWGGAPDDGSPAVVIPRDAGAAEDAPDNGAILDAEVLAVEVRELAPQRSPDPAHDAPAVPSTTPLGPGAELPVPIDQREASRGLQDRPAAPDPPVAARDAGGTGARDGAPGAPAIRPAPEHGPPAPDAAAPAPGARGATAGPGAGHLADAPAGPDGAARIDAASPAAEPVADRERAGIERRRDPAPPKVRAARRAADETRGDTTRRAPSKKGAARRRPRRRSRSAASSWALDGVDPRQVHSRRGVCSAYFVDQECWRVPDAYCNTALHVCAMRECPVYHLHRDVLERRFASKYKHLW